MFFRRSKHEEPALAVEAAAPAAEELPPAEPDVATTGVPPLPAAELRRVTDAKTLGFRSTAELEPAPGLVGQERALEAIAFGGAIKARDFNVFVLGPRASGKSTAVLAALRDRAARGAVPPDWVYVHDFDHPDRPKALSLPSGRGTVIARRMTETIDELRTTLPAAFEAEHYHIGRRAIEEEFRANHEDALEALKRKAHAQNIAILRTPMGFGMAPLHEGKVVKPEVYQQLPEQMRHEVEQRIGGLEGELQAVLADMPKAERTRQARLHELNEEIARNAVEAAMADVEAEFADLADVLAYLGAAKQDLVRNAGLFLAPAGEENALVRQQANAARDPRFRPYMVNALVSNEDRGQGAPVIEEINPAHGAVIGRVEHVAQMGALITDFLLIKPGALHKANGGYLVMDAEKLLTAPFVWEALKRALKSGEIRLDHPAEGAGVVSAQTLDPEPIPLDVKVFLLGDRELYYLLSERDPDFPRLFKVQADFDDAIARGRDNERAFARLVASVVARHGLLPLDSAAVARVIDEGARLAGDREKMSIEVGRIADLIREASHWAEEAGRQVVTRADVARAIDAHVRRADRLRERTQETIGRGVVLVDTEGEKAGQINGLSAIGLGDFAFGRPSRITARVRYGPGRVTDIEREAELGGPLHSKGVMILWGYLAGRYAPDVPLALAATLVFEQSYGGVDGDSASAAELFALLSALAETPIRQSLAVTGSVNQAGEIQAIGAVNEKIEGFFDLCKARGFKERQGVIIPRPNVQHLMLREDVVEAVRVGKFTVWAIGTVDEGMELLTGVSAGAPGPDGRYPENTINRLVEDRLRAFAECARAFAAAPAQGEKDDDYHDRARRRGR